MPLNSWPNSTARPSARWWTARLGGAGCVKHTRRGCHCAPSNTWSATADADHQLGGLAERSGSVGGQLGADHHQAAVFVHLHGDGLVVHVDVVHQRLEGAAQLGASRTSSARGPRLDRRRDSGHAQAEGRFAGLQRGARSSSRPTSSRHLQVRVDQAARRQRDARHQGSPSMPHASANSVKCVSAALRTGDHGLSGCPGI